MPAFAVLTLALIAGPPTRADNNQDAPSCVTVEIDGKSVRTLPKDVALHVCGVLGAGAVPVLEVYSKIDRIPGRGPGVERADDGRVRPARQR